MAGLYFHIPFCKRRCSYCSFISFDAPRVSSDEYLSALLAELESASRIPEVWSLEFETIYFGGGTPSLFPPRHVEAILDRARALFPILEDRAEITLEANPESVDLERLKVLRAAGVNRISLGFQSLDDKGLSALGRIHSALDAFRAFEKARKAGFDNIGVDLIYGWPGQRAETWERDLDAAVRLGPEHISCYELAIEDGTLFGDLFSQGRLKLPGEEATIVLADLAETILAEHGYEHYEISNFARPGFRSRHNMNYWANGAYLGFGCAAVSYIPPLRRSNTSDLAGYLDAVRSSRPPVDYEEALDHEARLRESSVLALRTLDGLSRKGLLERFGIDPVDYYRDVIGPFLDDGLIETDGESIRLTKRGRRIANYVMAAFV